jgi:hypothetical protein
MRTWTIAVALGGVLLSIGACFLGWFAAHDEYCQYGGSIQPGDCGTYELANLTLGVVTPWVGIILYALTVIGVLTISTLAESLGKFHHTLRQINPRARR